MPSVRLSFPFQVWWRGVLFCVAVPVRVLSWLVDGLFPGLRLSVRVLRTFGQRGSGRGGKTLRRLLLKGLGDVCLSSDESTLYVSDSYHRIVVVQTDSGQSIRHIGEQGSGPGQFEFPYRLALYEDRILFVCDLSNRRVQMLDVNTGVMLCELAVPQPGPSGFALASKHRLLYVANSEQHRIDVVTFDRINHTMQTSGHISSVISRAGGTRSLCYPRCLCVGGWHEQLLYCVDIHHKEGHPMLLCIDVSAATGPTLVYSAVPEYTDKVHQRIEPKQLHVSPDGHLLFLSDGYRYRLLVYSAADGQHIAQSRSGRDEGDWSPAGFCFSRQPQAGGHYNGVTLFVCNSAKHRIEVTEMRLRWPWSSDALASSTSLRRILHG